MATQSPYPVPEIESPQPGVVAYQEAPETELVTEDPLGSGIQDSPRMFGDPSKKPCELGSCWKNPESEASSEYSHEETRPEKIQERVQGLHHDMQDSLRRLQNLEIKLKNGAGKRRKRTNQADAEKNDEFQKALSDIMRDANENPSK